MSARRASRSMTPRKGQPSKGSSNSISGRCDSPIGTSRSNPDEIPVLPDMPPFFPDPALLDAEDKYLQVLRDSLFQREYEQSIETLYQRLCEKQSMMQREAEQQRQQESLPWGYFHRVSAFLDLDAQSSARTDGEDTRNALPSNKAIFSPTATSQDITRTASPSPTPLENRREFTLSPLGSVSKTGPPPPGEESASKLRLFRAAQDGKVEDTEETEFLRSCQLDPPQRPVYFTGPLPVPLGTLVDEVGSAAATSTTRAMASSVQKALRVLARKYEFVSFTAPSLVESPPTVTPPAVTVTPTKAAMPVAAGAGAAAGGASKTTAAAPSPTTAAPNLAPRYVSAFPLADALVLEAQQRAAAEIFCADICNEVVEAAANMYVSRCFDSMATVYTAHAVWDEVRDAVLHSFVPVDPGEVLSKEMEIASALSIRQEKKRQSKDLKQKPKQEQQQVIISLEERKEGGSGIHAPSTRDGAPQQEPYFGLLPAWAPVPSLLDANALLTFYDRENKPAVVHSSVGRTGRAPDTKDVNFANELISESAATPQISRKQKQESEQDVKNEGKGGDQRNQNLGEKHHEESGNGSKDAEAVPNESTPSADEARDNSTFARLLDNTEVSALECSFVFTRNAARNSGVANVAHDGSDPGAPPKPIPLDDYARYVVPRDFPELESPQPSPTPPPPSPPDTLTASKRRTTDRRRTFGRSSAASRRSETQPKSSSKVSPDMRPMSQFSPVTAESTSRGDVGSGTSQPNGMKRAKKEERTRTSPARNATDGTLADSVSTKKPISPGLLVPEDDLWTRALRQLPRGYFTSSTPNAMSTTQANTANAAIGAASNTSKGVAPAGTINPASSTAANAHTNVQTNENGESTSQALPSVGGQGAAVRQQPDTLVLIDGDHVTTLVKPAMDTKSKRDGASKKGGKRPNGASIVQNRKSEVFQPTQLHDPHMRLQVSIAPGGPIAFTAHTPEERRDSSAAAAAATATAAAGGKGGAGAHSNLIDARASHQAQPPSPKAEKRRVHTGYTTRSSKQQRALEERQRRQKEAAERAAYESQFITLPPPLTLSDDGEENIHSGETQQQQEDRQTQPHLSDGISRILPEPGVVIERWPNSTDAATSARSVTGRNQRGARGGARGARNAPRGPLNNISVSLEDEGVMADGGEWPTPSGRHRWAEFDPAVLANQRATSPSRGGANARRGPTHANASLAASPTASGANGNAGGVSPKPAPPPLQRGLTGGGPPLGTPRQARVTLPTEENKAPAQSPTKPRSAVLIQKGSERKDPATSREQKPSRKSIDASIVAQLPLRAKNAPILPKLPLPQKRACNAELRVGRKDTTEKPMQSTCTIARGDKIRALASLLQTT